MRADVRKLLHTDARCMRSYAAEIARLLHKIRAEKVTLRDAMKWPYPGPDQVLDARVSGLLEDLAADGERLRVSAEGVEFLAVYHAIMVNAEVA